MTDNTVSEIETALEMSQQLLPQLLAVIGVFYPPALVASKFLPLLNVALTGVQTVAAATGATTTEATAAVVNHLTPGAPDAAALSEHPTTRGAAAE